jgi:phage major head subunit gpT-like protein
MPITSSDIHDLLLPGLKAEFSLAYKGEMDRSVADRIATVVSTTQPIQRYAWIGAAPGMREFLDERRPAGLDARAFTIEDKTFESTIAVDRRAVEDDQLDLIKMRVRELALRVAAHRHQIVSQALVANPVGFDGAPLFGAHDAGGGATWTNATADDLGADALQAAIGSMMRTPDDAGVPLGIVPDTLLVGPKLMWQARELVESPVVVFRGASSGAAPTPYKNALMGQLDVVVSPFLDGAAQDAWFLLDTKRPMRSILLQQRSDVPVEFTALDERSGSESAFLRDRFYYGVRARYNVGPGLWQTAFAGGM